MISKDFADLRHEDRREVLPLRCMDTTKKIDPVSEARLRAFEHERRVKLVMNVAGYTGTIIIGALLLMIVAGDRFAPFLSLFGLRPISYQERGIYADCSNPDNRDNPFCSGKRPQIERSWNSISKNSGGPAVPFGLSD